MPTNSREPRNTRILGPWSRGDGSRRDELLGWCRRRRLTCQSDGAQDFSVREHVRGHGRQENDDDYPSSPIPVNGTARVHVVAVAVIVVVVVMRLIHGHWFMDTGN